MRKLAVIGALAAGAMVTATSAVAATVDTLVSGTLANNTNTCLQVLNTLTSTDDCSYAATRYPGPDSDIPKAGPPGETVLSSGFIRLGA
jgi:hypothetical protein